MKNSFGRIALTPLLIVLFNYSLMAQEMDFETYNPKSTLVVPEHPVKRAKFPFVDIHSHQRNVNETLILKLIGEMDEINMATMVNLSGKRFSRIGGDNNGQEYLNSMINAFNTFAPGRFIVFTNLSFAGFGEKDWKEKAVKILEEDVKNGANGLKIFKSLGLSVTDIHGKRVPINHPDLDVIWAKCGELGIPVLIHAADPAPFWEPMDSNNERWLELKLRPNRKRGANNPAPFEQIIAEQHGIFEKHKNTTFINAHMGWMANDLEKAAKHLDKYPNVNFGIAAVIAEFGRQPRAAKKFFIEYQDRILFGKDAYNKEEFYTYFRVLETEDEYFPYYKKYHAYWRMYGLGLPDEVLKKVYYKNALRIVPNIDRSLFPE
ncbi:amidohydrolase family protein [Cyclobacterium marinum]|uniref:Amidohydrolase 2 n=1 Tax=Cyclobacterium marinum (strain ATCC 25205 / DSM 745 / LMG 13164 / NCIMB 1802) TaxID=880070 RepID=G0IX62_CYCMS|nr:amidohydrolase family protein [Cyclobacterium marinum]AEL25610.1 amidohydrolase 2 [Cyclobacterium marinum DSM 745]